MMIFIFAIFVLISKVNATCPVCVLGVVASFSINKAIGMSDMLFAFWISALNYVFIITSLNFLNKKIKINKILLFFILFFLSYFPLFLQYNDKIFYKLDTIFGIDKFLFGMIVGFLATFFSDILYKLLYKLNGNKPHFPYQKVAMPLLILIIFSRILKYIEL